MFKYIKTTILFASVAMLSTSCDAFLSPINENIPNEEFVTSDPSSAEGILLNAYQILNNQHGWGNNVSTLVLSTGTDEAVSNQISYPYRRMVTGELTAQYSPLGSERWTNNYKAIFYVNQFLNIVDNVVWNNDSITNICFKRRLKGEALALRAFHHQLLLECFIGRDASGNLLGVKYFDTYVEPDEKFDLSRPSLDAMVESITLDYEAAYDLLPYRYSDSQADVAEKDTIYPFANYVIPNAAKYDQRMSCEIVRALQARLYLFVASKAYYGTSDATKSKEYNEKAIACASEVLTKQKAGAFVLASDGIEFYNEDADASSSEILWRQTKATYATPEQNNFPPSLNGKGYINPTQEFVDAFPMKDGYPINQSSARNIYNPQLPYLNRDLRLAKFVLFNNGVMGSTSTTTINTSTGDLDGINKVAQQSTRTGYYLKKLMRSDVTIPTSGTATSKEHYLPFIRFTEMFLIIAEAQNEIDYDYVGTDFGCNISSKEILRKIRYRANGSAISSDLYLDSMAGQDDLRTLIHNERRLELSFEGFRFFDLRRWEEKLDVAATGYYLNPETSEYERIDVETRVLTGDKYYSLPLPYTDVLKYGITQNYGW